MSIDSAVHLGAITNMVHGFIYFAPEATEEYDAVGLTPDEHYFASRAAPLGPVGPGVVTALFYNFRPSRVAAAVPSAWANASPDEVQAARMRAAGKVLDRIDGLPSGDELDAASEIAASIIAGVGYEGRPLAAANRDVALPDDPATRLWQQVTVIREWRGDAHVGALVAADVDAVEALALHVATGAFPASVAMATRGWSEDEWAAGVSRLAERGFVGEDGVMTDAGAAFRDALEATTNSLCFALVETVGAEAIRRFTDELRPIRKGLLEANAFPGFPRSS